MLSNTSSDKETTSLPPPSSLFNANYRYSPNNRSTYILPPPPNFPGYHLPAPHYPPLSSLNHPTTAIIGNNSNNIGSPSMEKKRKRRPQIEPSKKKKDNPSYLCEVPELKFKKTLQKRKVSEAAMSDAAVTLASFAYTQENEECVQLEACAGQGGNYVCERCGYNYKHLNCLQKHSWNHTEIHSAMTEQQQKQILEAAQILMNIARFGMKMQVLQ